MSGIKDVMVTMTRDERDRLLNSAQRANESKEQTLYRERLSQNALNAANMKLETLNRTLNNEISGLHDDMRSMVNEQNKRFKEQAAEYNRRIQQQTAEQNRRLQEQKAETDRKLQQQASDFSGRLENQRRELQSSINEVSQRTERYRQELASSINDVKQQAEKNRQELQSQINRINAKIEAKDYKGRKLAEFWISQTQAYISDIEQYRHDMFTPGQLEKLKGKLKQMLSNMENEMYEAAIATAMGLFNDAVDLKEVVLNAETEWLYYHGLFLQTLADTEANLRYYENLQFTFDTEQGKETIDAKINYWKNGILDDISASVSGVKQKTEQIQQISTQQIIDYIDTLNQQNVRMEIASSETKEAIISSQFRAEMASKLGEVLMAQGWTCDGSTYEGGEYNGKVHVKLSDIKGNEIVAVITPDENMVNNIEINFFNIDNDEGFRQTQLKSIQNSLKEDGGLNIGEAVCRKGYETKISDNYAIKDIQATATKKVQTAKN